MREVNNIEEQIEQYNNGQLTGIQELELFSKLIKTNIYNTNKEYRYLSKSIKAYMQAGILDKKGTINMDIFNQFKKNKK